MDKLIVILPSLNVKYCENTFVVFSARFSIYPTSGMDLMALLSSYFFLLLSTSSFIWGVGMVTQPYSTEKYLKRVMLYTTTLVKGLGLEVYAFLA